MKYRFLTLIFGAVLAIAAGFQTIAAQTSKVDPKRTTPDYKVGELVEAADYRGVWYRSKIVDFDESKGKYHVHFFGWSEDWDEWVTADKIRYVDDYEFGTEAEVSKEGVWYRATIVDSRFNTEHLVVFETGEEEWVKDDRIREAGEGWQRSRTVEVLYGKKWVRAQILKRRPGEVYVHYEGESDTWNAWISEDKIRRIR